MKSKIPSLAGRLLKAVPLTIAILLLLGWPARPQFGTPHGEFLKWNASTSTVAGYNIYRCLGTCTVTGAWNRIDVALDVSVGYLDPAANLQNSTTYSWASTAVDSAGSESVFSNIFTSTTPAAWPANPNPPTGLTGAPN
jgi:hypothetical protein